MNIFTSVDQYQNLGGHDVSHLPLSPWRKQQVPFKHLYLTTKLHCPTSEKRISLISLLWKPQILLSKLIFMAWTLSVLYIGCISLGTTDMTIYTSRFKPFCPQPKIINHACLTTHTVPVPKSNPANKHRFITHNNIFKNLTKFRQCSEETVSTS
jgi:hypothetical protein